MKNVYIKNYYELLERLEQAVREQLTASDGMTLRERLVFALGEEWIWPAEIRDECEQAHPVITRANLRPWPALL